MFDPLRFCHYFLTPTCLSKPEWLSVLPFLDVFLSIQVNWDQKLPNALTVLDKNQGTVCIFDVPRQSVNTDETITNIRTQVVPSKYLLTSCFLRFALV